MLLDTWAKEMDFNNEKELKMFYGSTLHFKWRMMRMLNNRWAVVPPRGIKERIKHQGDKISRILVVATCENKGHGGINNYTSLEN